MWSRALWSLLGALVLVAAVSIAFALLRPAVEAEARARVERAAREAGLSATIGSVRLTPWLSLELREVVLENVGRVRLMARSATVSPRLSFRVPPGRAARVSLEGAAVELPAGVRLVLAPSAWAVESGSGALSVRRLAPSERMELDVRRGRPGHVALEARATNARLSPLVRILLHGCPIAELGTVDGNARVALEPEGAVDVAVRGRAHGLAVAAWTTGGAEGCDDSMGVSTDAEIEAEARLETRTGSLRADRLRLVAGGAEVQARLAVRGGVGDPRVELEARVPRVDFARLLATAGLDPPAEDLGWASLTASVSGPLLDPAALRVENRLEFNPPARPLASIERLKGPFDHRAQSRDGATTLVRVGPDSPDFVPLAEVPPLLVRTLLIGEDANFYGHPGVDLKEVPVALARNLARGTFASGASTIPQQLAKNLFLSREKTVSRKLEELALALLIDSTLGKDRVLEIYLNVIEWGPRLYGLRPAARHYFGREPAELTPKQMAFLVALVPGPLKYQRSFAGGVLTPFLEGRMAALLAKLHEAGALGEDEYLTALGDPLHLRLTGTLDVVSQARSSGDGHGRIVEHDEGGPHGHTELVVARVRTGSAAALVRARVVVVPVGDGRARRHRPRAGAGPHRDPGRPHARLGSPGDPQAVRGEGRRGGGAGRRPDASRAATGEEADRTPRRHQRRARHDPRGRRPHDLHPEAGRRAPGGEARRARVDRGPRRRSRRVRDRVRAGVQRGEGLLGLVHA